MHLTLARLDKGICQAPPVCRVFCCTFFGSSCPTATLLHANWQSPAAVMQLAQAQPEEPRRKKGKARSDVTEDMSSGHSCIQACHEAAQALLAVAADACCTLQWSCTTAPAVAACSLAHSLLQWTHQLCCGNCGMPPAPHDYCPPAPSTP